MSVPQPGPRREELVDLLAAPADHLDAGDATTRRLAVAACVSRPGTTPQLERMLRLDPQPNVRRECAESLGLMGIGDPTRLEEALDDESAIVREAAVNALGELAYASSTPQLVSRALDDGEDSMVREAAVAALGSIADPVAMPALLKLVVDGPPQVRRRCVAALSVFEGSEVDAAIRRAAHDRNPMVREAAEMLVGRAVD